MSTAITRVDDTQALARLIAADERAQQRADESIPANTRRAYIFELKCFASWCTRHKLSGMPADPRTIRLYIMELADGGRDEQDLPLLEDPRARAQQLRQWKRGPLGYSTLMRALGAICTSHVRAEQPSPWNHTKIAQLRDHLQRDKGVRPKKKKAAKRVLFCRLLDEIDRSSTIGLRDAAMLAFGWWGARRRSEVVGAQVEHLTRERQGLIWLIPRAKTDQAGKGLEVPVPFAEDARYCAIHALDAWLSAAGIDKGPLFRAIDAHGNVTERALSVDAYVSRIKHYAKLARLPDHKEFSGHSMRSGWITTAADAGKSEAAIMETTGHKTSKVVREYIQHANLLDHAAGKGLL
jgi:integrase